MVRTLVDNLNEFTAAINNGEGINCTSDGEWYYECCLMRIIRYIFGLENRRFANITRVFNQFLDAQEKDPIKFNSSASITSRQITRLNMFLDAGHALTTVLKTRLSSSAICTQRSLLNRRIVALQYRYEAQNGGLDKVDRPEETPYRLRAIAQLWKDKIEILDPHDRGITEEEEERLKDVMQYSKFVDQLYKDPELQDAFFKWSLGNHNGVESFVEFPGRQKALKEAYLSLRIGRFRNDILRVEQQIVDPNQSGTEKHLSLMCEGHHWSILDDDQQITFNNNYTLSLREILDMFRDKNHDFGHLEVFEDGLRNWSTIHLGSYNPAKKNFDSIDLSSARKKDWWDQLPSIGRISNAEALKRYGKGVKDGKWGGRIVSTRERRDNSIKGNHVYIEIGKPNSDGTYTIFTFGKTSNVLPRRWWEYARALASTFPGVIAYPDSAIYNPKRQHKGCGFTMTVKESRKVMDWIRKSIQRGWDGQMAYQLLTENCAKWAEEIRPLLTRHRIPDNLFKVRFEESEPEGCAGRIFSVVRQLPYCIQDCFFSIFFWPLGSTTSMTVKENGQERVVSLASMKPWRPDSEYRIPGVQIQRLDEGELQPTFG